MRKFFRSLINDSNDINEKVFVGLVGLSLVVLITVADLVSGLMGTVLVIHEYVFDGALILTLTSLGIATTGQIFKRPSAKKEEEKEPEV
jgi:tellurite resistance protein TehA-like permease